jgi:hypothetical protein
VKAEAIPANHTAPPAADMPSTRFCITTESSQAKTTPVSRYNAPPADKTLPFRAEFRFNCDNRMVTLLVLDPPLAA